MGTMYNCCNVDVNNSKIENILIRYFVHIDNELLFVMIVLLANNVPAWEEAGREHKELVDLRLPAKKHYKV